MNKLIVIALVLFSSTIFSAETKSVKEAAITYPEASDVRCEKLSGHSLVEFKAKLVENCDLNKPFSSSMSKLLNEESYFYCCQIKK